MRRGAGRGGLAGNRAMGPCLLLANDLGLRAAQPIDDAF